MGRKIQDLTGIKFNKLTVINRLESENKHTMWLCKCECGEVKSIRASHLKDGHIKSCGCLWSKHGHADKERLYKIWCGMNERCRNKNANHYKLYGGRGITVCDEWKNDYMNFRSWATANGYLENLSIDRINSNGNYEPSNCRWATQTEQIRNRSNTKTFEYNGEVKTIAEWAEKLNIDYKTFKNKIRYGNIKTVIEKNLELLEA